MDHLPHLSLALLASTVVLAAAIQSSQADDDWQKLYDKGTYKNPEGQTLPYRLMKPETVGPGQKYPLVLFLHGLGERGDDNAAQLVHGAADFATAENRRKYPCFVVAPQCHPDDTWVPEASLFSVRPMNEQPTESLKLALELVDQLAADLPVDPQRIYITGLSMGGFGTWESIIRRPDFFAAALPVCGGGDPAYAEAIKNLPIWAFHGDADNVVVPARTKTMIEAVQKAGGTPKMTIYPGVAHNSWAQTYADPEAMRWLFSQTKPGDLP